MSYDTNLKLKGIKILVEYLGDIETEKFLAMVRQDPFDYTLWQTDLWKDKSVGEISAAVMEYYKQNHDTSGPAAKSQTRRKKEGPVMPKRCITSLLLITLTLAPASGAFASVMEEPRI